MHRQKLINIIVNIDVNFYLHLIEFFENAFDIYKMYFVYKFKYIWEALSYVWN